MTLPPATFEARIGSTVIALLHLGVAALVAVVASGSHGDQSGVIWVPLTITDFPVSLGTYWAAVWLFRMLPFIRLSGLPAPFNDPGFIVPAFTHIVVGSIWYYIMSLGLWKAWKLVRGGHRPLDDSSR